MNSREDYEHIWHDYFAGISAQAPPMVTEVNFLNFHLIDEKVSTPAQILIRLYDSTTVRAYNKKSRLLHSANLVTRWFS